MRQNKNNKMKPINITAAVKAYEDFKVVCGYGHSGPVDKGDSYDIVHAADILAAKAAPLTAALYNVQGKAREFVLTVNDVCEACAWPYCGYIGWGVTVISNRATERKRGRQVHVTRVEIEYRRGNWWVVDIRRVTMKTDFEGKCEWCYTYYRGDKKMEAA